MLLLCLDSSAAASAALVGTPPDPRPLDDAPAGPPEGPPRVLAAWSTEDTRSHAEVLTPAVERILAESDTRPEQLDGLLVGTGPGPFTGLRAGLVTARVLGFGWGLPVYGMTSLAALAHDVVSLPEGARPSSFAVAADARRQELYWAQYRLADGQAELVSGPHVGPAEQLPDLPVYGRGAGLYAQRLAEPMTEPIPSGPVEAPSLWQPSAQSLGLSALARIARGGQLSQDLTPLYLRESDAKVPGPRKRAGA